jgi:uncharacterized protein YprB with RNaseH-like and TPR domain
LIFDIETTGLDPSRDRILTIQIRRDRKNKIWKSWDSDEFTIIDSFLEFLKGVDGNEPIYGFNVLKFDLPFLLARIANYRTREGISRSLWKLIFNKRWLDLYQILGDSYLSLREWLVHTKFKNTQRYSGRDIPVLYSRRKYKQILAYINEELRLQEALIDRINRMPFYKQLVRLQRATSPEKIDRLLGYA